MSAKFWGLRLRWTLSEVHRRFGEPAPQGAVYLNTSHSGLLAPGLGLCLRVKGIQPIWMVHDLIPITHHEYCRPGEDDRHMRRMRSVLRHAAALLTNSKATKDELLAFAREAGLEMPPCVVARLAPGLKAVEFGPPPLAKPYFVVISTIEPRKNLAMLLQVWRRLAQRHGQETPSLVLVGQRGWECENVIDLLERSAPLHGLVIEKGRCSDKELATLLKHARALLFPSFVEGYGLPLAEALDIGTPVIASDLQVFREIAGDVPDYLDPLDGPAWLAPWSSTRRLSAPEGPRSSTASWDTWRRLGRNISHVVDELIRSRLAIEELGVLSINRRRRGRGRHRWLTKEAFRRLFTRCGFSLRKRPMLRRFLPECAVRFVRSISEVPAGATLATWGFGDANVDRSRNEVVRIEDGFLRSVGLGAELVAPMSWTIDSSGIYYDASRPSDLERLLEHGSFSAHTLERAARLRAAIVSGGLTKYNVGSRTWKRPATTQRVILVPGQVERDESIRLGAPDIKRNIDLLRAVRSSCPDAHVIISRTLTWLPVCDALESTKALASQWCDEIVEDADIGDMLCHVDEVHTMTSLTGFEALLRQRRVVTYGQPFYAGWGLTEDKLPNPRRTRRLTLDQLVAGALLLYPRYVSRATGKLISAEDALTELLAWKDGSGRRYPLKSVVRAPMRQLLRLAGDR